MQRCKRALISVSDKTGIVDFARSISGLGIEIVSTGGTATALRTAGLPVTDVSEVTGFPEIMDGRVKTLHPLIHGGILARRRQDATSMSTHGIAPIDLVVINLYPFEATIAQAGCTRPEAIEQIDIGGPAMIRAAAKNHAEVAVVVDPADYPRLATELVAGGGIIAGETRAALARKAFAHTASYDAAIWAYLREIDGDTELPERLPLGLVKQASLRYGENPHQRGALYRVARARPGTVAAARLCQGKELSYNNLADADAALECAASLGKSACVIVKHANPCGVAVADTPGAAYDLAYATDPTSAFGGIIAFNVAVDAELAQEILARQFVEVVVAPTYSSDALEQFARKPNVRVLEAGDLDGGAQSDLRCEPIGGGFLVQDRDAGTPAGAKLEVVTRRAPDAREREDALLAWQVARFVKSNAIVFVRDGRTIGIGAGQMSRVMSVRIAAWKAEEAGLDVHGAALASDAFFPFRDGIDLAAGFGIRTVIQPGGSIRDDEVVSAANEHDLAMLFTGIRHFRH